MREPRPYRCIAATALVLAGCGSDASRPAAPGPQSLPIERAPAVLIRSCRRAAAGTGVRPLCARKFLAGARLDRRLQQFGGHGFYAYEAVFNGLPDVGTQHVVFGGQSALVGPRGFPTRLGFHGGVELRGHTTVNGSPGYVFVSRLARGGINGGHVVVGWNADGGAYFASVHLDRLRFARRVATARALAESMVP